MIFKKKPANRYIIILTVLFGLVLLCAIWTGLYYKIQSEQQQELEAARKETANYARMFEEHTIRTLRGLDEIAIYIKHQAEDHGLNVDLVKLKKERMLEGQPFSSLGIIDENGDLIASSRGSFPNVNIRDREVFRVHKDVDSNKLYVGMPLVGRVSGQVSIHMSRRINKPDGSFGGIIFIGVDPNYFGEFYKQIDLGANSVIALIGIDGIVRVRQSDSEVQVGADFSDYPEVMNTLAGSGSGTRVKRSPIDGISRITSYRILREYSLTVSVGMTDAYAFKELNQRIESYIWACGGMSAVILLFVALQHFAIKRRSRTEAELLANTSRIHAITQSTQDAVLMMDPQGRISFWNPAATRIFGYTEAEVLGRNLHQLLAPPRYHERQQVACARFLQTGTGSALGRVSEMGVLHKDGHEIPAEMSLSGIQLQSGWHAVGIVRDVTERKKQEAVQSRMANIQSVLRKIAEAVLLAPSMNELYVIVQQEVNQVLSAQQLHINILDEATQEIVVPFNAEDDSFIPVHRPMGKGLTEYVMQLGHAVYFTPKELDRLMETGEITLFEVQNIKTCHYLGVPLVDSQGKAFGVMAAIQMDDNYPFQVEDIEVFSIIAAQVSMAIERKKLQDELQLQARTDSLTGMLNRREFMRRSGEELSRMQRYGGECGFLIFDIDYFKRINDRYGHAAGDETLRAVAAVCSDTLRVGDVLGRIGGEEFAALLIETDEENCEKIAQRLRLNIQEATIWAEEGERIELTVSIGVTMLKSSEDTLADLLQRADTAMYQAKADGRNRVVMQ